MTGQDQRQGGSKRPSIGSVLIVFILKIFGGFFGLFHGKKTYSNLNPEEQKAVSPMLDGMKQDMAQKTAGQGRRGDR